MAEQGNRTKQRRPNAVWREQALSDIAGAQLLANRLRATKEDNVPAEVFDGIDESLAEARAAAAGDHSHGLERMVSAWRGAEVERAWGQLDAAEEAMLAVARDSYVRGQLPRMLARTRRALPHDDPRRVELEAIVDRTNGKALNDVDREVLNAVFHATNCEARRKQTRVRSFRNLLIATSLALWLAVIGLGVLGFTRPDLLPICFNPTGHVVCPTAEEPAPIPAAGGASGQPAVEDLQVQARIDDIQRDTVTPWDIFLIEAIGLIAAAVAAAAALREIRGTSTPYSVPVALAALKLPTGALTAVLGLMLMRGQFVPGLSALDFPAQIIAWAVIFGYAQQLFTRLVDQRAQSVLENAVPVAAPPPAGQVRGVVTSRPADTAT